MPLPKWLVDLELAFRGDDDENAPSPDDGSATPPTGPDAPGVSGDKSVAELRKSIDAIRANIRAFGAAIGTGATAILAGLGWTTIHNLFPPPQKHAWIALIGVLLGIVAVIASLLLTALFFAAQRRVVFKPSDPKGAVGLAKHEQTLVEQVLVEHASEEGASSAAALEMRALRLERIARERAAPDDTDTKALVAEAARLNDRLVIAGVRAAASVVESRNEALFRASHKNIALIAAAMAASSIIGLFFLADFSKGQRELIDLQAKCAKVAEAKRPTACEDVSGQTPAASTSPAATKTVTATPTPNLKPIESLRQCADALPNSTTLPPVVRQQALLTCAGLPTPSTAIKP